MELASGRQAVLFAAEQVAAANKEEASAAYPWQKAFDVPTGTYGEKATLWQELEAADALHASAAHALWAFNDALWRQPKRLYPGWWRGDARAAVRRERRRKTRTAMREVFVARTSGR